MSKSPSLQEQYYTDGMCFGCGPKNEKGLRIRSFLDGDQVVAEWTAQPHHEAFEGVLNGGIVGSLLDCHSNWACLTAFMREKNLDVPPSTVTAKLDIQYFKPTPSTKPIRLIAKTTKIDGNKATVEAQIVSDGDVCAKSLALFVAVGPEHPGYMRWE